MKIYLGSGLIFAAIGYGITILFHQQFNPGDPDFSVHILGMLFLGLAEVVLSVVLLVMIARWF